MYGLLVQKTTYQALVWVSLGDRGNVIGNSKCSVSGSGNSSGNGNSDNGS